MQRNLISLLFAVGTFAATARGQATPAAAPSTPANVTVPTSSNTTAADASATEPPLIQIGGSDLLQIAIGEPLARYVKQNNVSAKVDLYGSIPALTDLKGGRTQLAIVATPPGRTIAPEGYTVIPLCFQVDYVIVNEKNPINSLDLRQIAGVFGTGRDDLTRWADVQLAGEWATHAIQPFITSTDDGIVVELFKILTLGRRPLKPAVQIKKTSQELVAEISGNPNAIGVCGYDPGPPAKVLLLAPERPTGSSTSRDPVRPTPENVNNGSYPLRLPFYIVFKPSDKGKLREILRLLLSEEYAASLRAQHFVPVPETLRNRSLLELDKAD